MVSREQLPCRIVYTDCVLFRNVGRCGSVANVATLGIDPDMRLESCEYQLSVKQIGRGSDGSTGRISSIRRSSAKKIERSQQQQQKRRSEPTATEKELAA